MNAPVAVIVLAAGEGTRMRSATPKVLHHIGGRSLIGHALYAARQTTPEHLAVVVRHHRDLVAAHVSEVDPGVVIADQDEVKGTGRATECGLAALPGNLVGTVLVTYGDVPLLTGDTLKDLVGHHQQVGAGVTVVTAELPDPTGYGRILRDEHGNVKGIMEHKDALAERAGGGPWAHALDVQEINSGIYAFDADLLRRALTEVGTDNAQGEKYLTDVLAIARREAHRVAAHLITDRWQTEGVNDRVQLATLGAELNTRIVAGHQRAGVSVIDPLTTWIDADVTIGQDSLILPGCQLLAGSRLGANVTVGPDSTLTGVEVGDGAALVRTHAESAVIGAGATVGPFAYLRPGTNLGARGKIGTFVETKNAQIGEATKVPHLTYVGDATIGEHSNIGASSVFVNYDGVAKHHTEIGSHCRMGSDTMYVAPLTIGDGAGSGAGTVIRRDVPAGALAINVSPQRNIEGWAQSRRPGTPQAAAAAAATRHTGQEPAG